MVTMDTEDTEDTGGTAPVEEKVATTRTGRSRATIGAQGTKSRQEMKPAESTMLNTKVLTWSLSVFTTVTFIVCVLYGLIVPEVLHMTGFLEQMLPGFEWLTPTGFAIGLVESFLYGAYVGLVFGWIYNAVWRRSVARSA